MKDIVVLGTGMAGYGATCQLNEEGIRPVVYDKNTYYGGHTASFRDEQGFIFDLGPHISFTKDERIQGLFADYVGHEYESVQVHLNNYWKGVRLMHPAQLHLHGLPHDLIVEIISDFVEEKHGEEREINNYEDWLIASYGRKFAELFPMQYTRKYHLTEAFNMSTDWLGPRMYRPNFEEMLRGALSAWVPEVEHYVSHFRYPTNGGFLSYLAPFPGMGELRLSHEVAGIDPKERRVRFANDAIAGFDGLVTSIPLPDLVPMIDGTPQDIVDASRQLACSTCALVNIGVDREDLSDAHMTYFYDADICFTRLSFPHMLSPNNAPPGCGSIQAEVYYSPKYRPMDKKPDDLIEPVITDLTRAAILKEDENILFRDAKLIQYANIIFDLDRASALETVHGYLDDLGIGYCGRYGDWDYMWTDQSFISGENAAVKVLSLI